MNSSYGQKARSKLSLKSGAASPLLKTVAYLAPPATHITRLSRTRRGETPAWYQLPSVRGREMGHALEGLTSSNCDLVRVTYGQWELGEKM